MIHSLKVGVFWVALNTDYYISRHKLIENKKKSRLYKLIWDYSFINFQQKGPPIRLFSPIFLLIFKEFSHLYFYSDPLSIQNSRVQTDWISVLTERDLQDMPKIWILKEITLERCTSDQLNTFSTFFFSDQVLIWKKRRKKCFTGQRCIFLGRLFTKSIL